MTVWRVPLSDIDIGSDEVEAVTEVIRSGWLTMGPRTDEFEQEFARRHEARFAVAVSSCTAALHLSYAALGISAGDEVIMPSMTFVATANAAVVCGAKPVFADVISEDEPTIDPAHVESLITPLTRAIVVVHYAGYPCRMAEMKRIAEKHNLPIVEDCAHAPGVRFGDRYLGTLGSSGCFSFFSNKNMTTGEGGMVVTQDEQFAERVRLLRSHGMTSGTWKRHNERPQGYDVLEAGWNYRIDEMRSALGLIQLRKLDQANARRAELVSRYRTALESAPGARVAFGSYSSAAGCHILPLIVTNASIRQGIVNALNEARVQSSHHYSPVHLFQLYRERFGYGAGMLPNTEAFGLKEITLPLYSGMTNHDVDYVTEAIRNAVHNTDRQPAGVGTAP